MSGTNSNPLPKPKSRALFASRSLVEDSIFFEDEDIVEERIESSNRVVKSKHLQELPVASVPQKSINTEITNTIDSLEVNESEPTLPAENVAEETNNTFKEEIHPDVLNQDCTQEKIQDETPSETVLQNQEDTGPSSQNIINHEQQINVANDPLILSHEDPSTSTTPIPQNELLSEQTKQVSELTKEEPGEISKDKIEETEVIKEVVADQTIESVPSTPIAENQSSKDFLSEFDEVTVEEDEGDEDSDVEIDDQKSDNLFSKSLKQIFQGKRGRGSVVRCPEVQLDKYGSNIQNFLQNRFKVIKFNPKKRAISKKLRVWEIDFFSRKLINCSRTGKVQKTLDINDLVSITKLPNDSKKVTLSFLSANHPYELHFDSGRECECFYEAVLSMRPYEVVYSPDLLPPSTTGIVQPKRTRVVLRKTGSEANAASIVVSSQPVEEISVFCGTWNLGKYPPPPFEAMKDFISKEHDLYALAFQESNFKDAQYEDIFQYIKSYFGNSFIVIEQVCLWEIRLMVLVRDVHIASIQAVESGIKATGFMNILGNKGAVAVSFKVYETSFCFIGSHLTAKEEKMNQRNNNIYEIWDNIKLGNKELDLYQFSHIFWMGDLNFRIDMPYELGVQVTLQKDYEELLQHDQLIKQIQMNSIFSEFKEGKINFMPSYRFNIGDRTYSKEKSRTPSYCDRILYRSLPNCKLTQTSYNSSNTIVTSDHSPVYATFQVETQLRYITSMAPLEKNRRFIISKAYVAGRNGNLISKPKLTFMASFLDKPVQTSKGKKTAALVNPQFEDSCLPHLVPCLNSQILLEREHVIVRLSDDNTTIGYAFLSLQEVLLLPNTLVNFSPNILYKCQKIGVLHCCIKMISV